jgi:PadR family transcriptional regulator PadR
MSKGKYLGEFEQLVMLAVLRLGDGASGMTVRRELDVRARRAGTIGSVYGTLERLEEKGLLSSRRGQPDPVRGGRARRYFRVEPPGEAALREARERTERMWEGVELATDGTESS